MNRKKIFPPDLRDYGEGRGEGKIINARSDARGRVIAFFPWILETYFATRQPKGGEKRKERGKKKGWQFSSLGT